MNTAACDYIDAPEFDDYAHAIATQLAPLFRANHDHPRNGQRSHHSAHVAHEEIAAA
jgi:hypothetical protein